LILAIIIISAFSTPLTYASLRGKYVYDEAYLLYDYEIELIDALCASVDNATTAEIVIVTLSNLNQFQGDINKAKLALFNNIELDGIVGIGKKGKDNGILLVVSLDEELWGVEVGYGLEGDLTDAEAGRVGRLILSPKFKEGDYYSGIFESVATIAEEIGYDVENYTPILLVEPDINLIDLLFKGDWGYIIFWLLGNGSPYAILLVAVIILLMFFSKSRFGGGGGRSGGGGASGRW